MTAVEKTLRQRFERWFEIVARSIVFQVVAVLVLYDLLWQRLFIHCQLSASAYFQPVLVFEAVKVNAVLVLLLLPILVLFVGRKHVEWRRIDPGRHTRWLIVGISGILMWAFATSDVNLFFDQSYWVDRLLLFALWLALLIHPIFIVPFLVLLMTVAMQLYQPLPEGPWIWPDKRLPLDMLVLFLAYLVVASGLRDRIKPMLLPFVFLCLVGATYAHAAVNKMLLGPSVLTWPLDNHLSNLVVSSYLNGNWLGSLGDAGILHFSRLVDAVGVPLAIGTLIAEGAGFLLLVHWKFTRLILIGFVLLHVGILATSGIFFWKWMVVDLALLIYLTLLRRDAAASEDPEVVERPRVHSRLLIALGFVVMWFGPAYFHNVSFAWFDSKLANFFEIYAIGESGERYRLDPRFFAPYELIVQQSRHYYAANGPVIVGTYGSSGDWRVVDALENAKLEDLPAVRRLYGRRFTSPDTARVFFAFIQRYVVNAERRRGRRSVISWLAPPYHFQRSEFANHFDFQEPVAEVEIRFVEYMHGADSIEKTLDVLVVRFEIRSSALADE